MKKEKNVEPTSKSGGSTKPLVRRRTANEHAKNIVKQLHHRPVMNDADGYYDFLADEAQMVKIIEDYLQRFFA